MCRTRSFMFYNLVLPAAVNNKVSREQPSSDSVIYESTRPPVTTSLLRLCCRFIAAWPPNSYCSFISWVHLGEIKQYRLTSSLPSEPPAETLSVQTSWTLLWILVEISTSPTVNNMPGYFRDNVFKLSLTHVTICIVEYFYLMLICSRGYNTSVLGAGSRRLSRPFLLYFQVKMVFIPAGEVL